MTLHKTALRLPKPMHKDLLDAASKSGISMNAEIIKRLQITFDADKNPPITTDTVRQIATEVFKELSKK